MESLEGATQSGRSALVLGCAAGMFFSIGIVLIYGLGVFVVPIAQDTGWSRTSVAAVIAPIALVNGLASPFVGLMCDRWGPRAVLLVSAATTAVGLIFIGASSVDYSSFVIAAVVASILGGAQTGVPYTYVLVGWFRSQRGLALGVALSFVGVGIAAVPPALSFLIAAVGWRAAFALAGLAVFAVTFPIAVFVVKDPPARDATSASSTGPSWRQDVSRASFWLLLCAFTTNYFVATAGSISLPIILVDRGVGAPDAAGIMTVVGLSFTVSRLLFGALLDRFPALPLTSLFFVAAPLGHLVLALTDGVSPAYLSAALFGMASGAEGDAMGYLIAQRFGTRNFGKLYGFNYLAFTIGAGSGPPALSLISGEGTRYGLAFGIFAALGIVSPIILMSDWVFRSANTERNVL